MKILIGILMLCVIVIAHELGHFLIAKCNHIEVKEFWVGFGPKLFDFTKGETRYVLRAIPFGGACVFENENPEEEELSEDGSNESDSDKVSEAIETGLETSESVAEDDSDSVKYDKKGHRIYKLNEAPILSKIATLIAGPLFNFIMAFLLAIIVTAFTYIPSAKLNAVSENSPAAEAGLMAGDEIVKINGSRVFLYPEVSLAIQTGVGRPLEVTYSRDGAKYKTSLIPEMNDEYGYYMIGVSFGDENEYANKNALSVISDSYKYVRYMVKMTYLSFKMLITGQASVKDMSGPVGVVSIVSSEYDAAAEVSVLAIVVSMVNIAVLISANLGVINLLPFPALDGGRLIFALYELITGRKVDERVEGFIHLIGSALIVILMIIILFNDITRLFTGFYK